MCSLKVATCAHESRSWVLQQCRDGLNLDAVLPYHLRHTMSMRTVPSANKRAQVKEERLFCSPSTSTEIQSLTRSAPCASERRDRCDNGMKGSVLQREGQDALCFGQTGPLESHMYLRKNFNEPSFL